MDQLDPQIIQNQKIIHRVTRLAGLGLFAAGVLILVMGGDVILGSVLTIIGLTDMVLMPQIIEKVMIAKLKQRHDKGQ